MRRFGFILILCAGCAPFPELDGTLRHDVQMSEYPAFLTTVQLQALDQGISTQPQGVFDARLARLRARAAALRGPVFTSGDRTRLTATPG